MKNSEKLNMKKKIILVVLVALYFGYSIYNTKKTRELELAISYSSLRQSNWVKTINLCDKMLQYIPNHPDANFAKAGALAQHGQYQKAIAPYDRAIEYHYLGGCRRLLHESYYMKGDCLRNIGELEQALESSDLAIKHGYEHRSIFNLRNNILMELGQFPG
jgi:tetratricopeptide (TPR) repeat protein